MPAVKVGDINIYYETHGDGEPLLLIMGYGSNSGHWLQVIPILSRQYRVIAFDNRGTGRSDKPDIPYRIEMMAGDAAGLLAALGIDAAHVFGISMGGRIAQELAVGYPERVASLVLGCTSPGGPNAVPRSAEAKAALFDQAARLPVEQRAREMIPWIWRREFIDSNPDIVEQYVAVTGQHPTPPHAYYRQGQAIMSQDTYDRLPRIKVPTLVIAGTGDRIVPVENASILASRIPGAELVILEGAGHGFITDTQEEATRHILDFLGRHRRSG